MPETAGQQSLDDRRASYLIEHTGRALLLAFVGWTLLIVYSYHWNDTNLRREKVVLATSEARSLWNKDQAFRQWATRHGGVYVRPDARTAPNPNLANLPMRDVVTTAGMRLTLMNPAYMMRQMTEEFEKTYGIRGKITALQYLNEVNAPDDWERAILQRYAAVEEGEGAEVVEEMTIDGEPYLRYMKPMYMKPACLKCHDNLGLQQGELRGGVSISIPLASYFDAATEAGKSALVTHLGVWLIGSLGIGLFGWHAGAKRRERTALLLKLEHNALYDDLTGLPTRTLLIDRINQALAVAARDREHLFGLCFVDLDRFKHINDAFGHAVGDLLLCRVGEILNEFTRPSDTVARLGGDEYIVLLGRLHDADEAFAIAERIRNRLSEPLQVEGQAVQIGASLGIALSGSTCSSAEDMIRNADIAMYRAKHDAGGGIEVYRAHMRTAARELSEIENGLQQALRNGEFDIHYQPIVDLVENRVCGFEALLRWQHPQRGFIPPDSFIAVAEDIGMIDAIGAWVIDHACARLHDWQQRFGDAQRPLALSVNLSVRQLVNDSVVTQVERALARYALEPGLLHLEVTETALIREQEYAHSQLARLRALGCKLSADDFGTGYSSLTYLQQYHFDSFKIDKQFVQDASDQGTGLKLCNALIGLADDLGVDVIAEGVETEEQRLRLERMGCRFMQGYFFARPLPAAAIDTLFSHGEHRDLGLLLAASAA